MLTPAYRWELLSKVSLESGVWPPSKSQQEGHSRFTWVLCLPERAGRGNWKAEVLSSCWPFSSQVWCTALFKSNGLNRRGCSEPGLTWPLFRMLYPLRTDFPAVISDHILEGSFGMVPFRLVMLIADASVSATWRKTPSQAKDILYLISHFTSMLGNIFPLRKGIRCFIFWESYKTTHFFPHSTVCKC